MNLKANYIEIENLATFLNEKSEELDNKFSEIKTLFITLGECWTGVDSRNFVSFTTTYISNLKKDIVELKNISELLKYVSANYRYQDRGFEIEMKKERIYDEN